MKRVISLSLLIVICAAFIAACGSGSAALTPTVPPNPAEIYLTIVANEVAADATKSAVDNVFTVTAQVVGATQTQQFVYVQATATQQARIDAEATSAQERKDAQATQQRIDADARATQQRIDFESTQEQARRDAQATADQARLDLQATQQAEATATAFTMTQAVIPTHNLWTQEAVEQAIIIGTNQVEKSNLEVEQQKQKNTPEWVIPYSIALVAMIVGALYVIRISRTNVVKDDDGKVQVIIHDNEKVIKPRLLPKPLLQLRSGEMPDLTDPKEQSEIVKRDQAIAALEAMPDNPSKNAADNFNAVFSGQEQKKLPVIEITSPEQIGSGVLDEIEGQVLEEGDD